MDYLAAQRAIYEFMASCAGRDSFRDYSPDLFGEQESMTSHTRLLTKLTSALHLKDAVDIPHFLECSGNFAEVSKKKGYIFTDDNLVQYGKVAKIET